jgi:hypothetical protein
MPPTEIWQNGWIPGEPCAAQYDTFWRHHMARQSEISARIPFRNVVAGGSYATAHPVSSAYIPKIGGTIFATAENNKFLHSADFGLSSPATQTLSPASGTFVARAVADDPISGQALVFGTNSTAPTASYWTLAGIGGFAAEQTAPVSGGCYKATTDRVTGRAVAFFDDASRSVYATTILPGSLQLVGTRPAGPALSGLSVAVAVNNNVAVIAYTTGLGANVIETATLSSTSPPSVWSTYTIPFTGVQDLRWSDAYQCWLALSAGTIYAFTNPAGPYTQFEVVIGGANIGCLFDTGACVLNRGVSATAYEAWIRDDLNDPGANPAELRSLGGAIGTGAGFALCDGSAIWMCGADPGAQWVRTLRVS